MSRAKFGTTSSWRRSTTVLEFDCLDDEDDPNGNIVTFGGNVQDDREGALEAGSVYENDAYDDDWFVSVNADNYRLDENELPGSWDDASQFQAGDPATDIDGDSRPTEGYPGIDEPQ